MPRWRTAWIQVAGCVLVALVVGLAYARVMAYTLRAVHHRNYSGFVHIQLERFDHNPLVMERPEIRRSLIFDSGYDGQFMYYMAFDPFLREFGYRPFTYRSVVDAPTYRYGRIAFSVLTKIFAGDRWRRFPQTMIWLIVSGVMVSALMISLIAVNGGAGPWWGLIAAIIPGFWPSMLSALPEPIAAAALLAGYLFALHHRWALAGACLALSLLTRETGIVFVACLVVERVLRGDRREAWRLGLIAVAPMILWRLYVASILYSTFGREAFFMNPDDLGVPFGGFVELWSTIARGAYFPETSQVARAGVWYPVVLTFGFILSAVLAVRMPSAITVAAVIYALIAVSLNYGMWEGLNNGVRGTYEIFVMLALVTVRIGRDKPALRVGAVTFWGFTAAYVVFLALDAPHIRAAILP